MVTQIICGRAFFHDFFQLNENAILYTPWDDFHKTINLLLLNLFLCCLFLPSERFLLRQFIHKLVYLYKNIFILNALEM